MNKTSAHFLSLFLPIITKIFVSISVSIPSVYKRLWNETCEFDIAKSQNVLQTFALIYPNVHHTKTCLESKANQEDEITFDELG